MTNLTREREALGLTRTGLGRKARLHPARVGQIELGRVRPPRGSVELARLAKALGWKDAPEKLLDDAVPVASPSPSTS